MEQQQLFFNPEKYNFIPFPNIWDNEPTPGEFLVGVDTYNLDKDPPKMFISRIQVDTYGNPVVTYPSRTKPSNGTVSNHYPLG